MPAAGGGPRNDSPRILARSNITACNRCRRRKQKCDQKLPKCQSCEKAGVECVGYDAVTKRHIPRSYVHSLEERVAFLELKLQSHGIRDLDSDLGTLRPTMSPSNTNGPSAVSELQRTGQSPVEPENSMIRPLLEAKAKETAGTLSQMLRFGTQTEVSFTRVLFAELHRTEATIDLAQAWEEPHAPGEDGYVQFEVPKDLDPSPVSLPEKRVAEHLTRVYFEFANFSSPALHEPTFRRKLDYAYSMLETSNARDGDRYVQAAFFFSYMVFAVALLTLQKHDATGVPTSLCERYYTAALRCLDMTGLPADLEGVQVLLLIAQYSYLHPSVFSTWKTVGMALRLAVELGLHQEPPPGKVDPLTLDTRRRVFWVAYSMDRTVGTILGRPFCLSDGAIETQYPSPVNDELITSEGIATGASTALGKKAFSLHYFRYRQLQSEIQVTLREQKPAAYAPLDYEAWQQDMHERLEYWHSSTPRDSAPSNIAPPEVLELAFHQAIICLYRPSPMISSPSESAMVVLADSSSFFIKLYRRLHRENKLRLFWQAVHNLFAAGTALLYCYSHSVQVRERMSFRAIEASVHACSSALWAMVERFPAAKGKRDAFDAIASATLDSIESTIAGSTGGGFASETGSSPSDINQFPNASSAHPPLSTPTGHSGSTPMMPGNQPQGSADMAERAGVQVPGVIDSTTDFMSWTGPGGEGIADIDSLALDLDVFHGAGSLSLSTWV